MAWAVIGLLGGSAVVGPPSIRNGRAVFNEAINDTNNQQMLQVVIRECYAENSSLLAVSSVTANVSTSTSAGFQFGRQQGQLQRQSGSIQCGYYL